jgi:hypothetical protein
MRGIGNLCIGQDDDPRYDPRRLIELLLQGQQRPHHADTERTRHRDRADLRGGGSMTWLTWRRHRAETAVLTLLVAATAAVLLVLGLSMHGLFPDDVARCAVGGSAESCTSALQRLWEEHGYASRMLSLLNLLP